MIIGGHHSAKYRFWTRFVPHYGNVHGLRLALRNRPMLLAFVCCPGTTFDTQHPRDENQKEEEEKNGNAKTRADGVHSAGPRLCRATANGNQTGHNKCARLNVARRRGTSSAASGALAYRFRPWTRRNRIETFRRWRLRLCGELLQKTLRAEKFPRQEVAERARARTLRTKQYCHVKYTFALLLLRCSAVRQQYIIAVRDIQFRVHRGDLFTANCQGGIIFLGKHLFNVIVFSRVLFPKLLARHHDRCVVFI